MSDFTFNNLEPHILWFLFATILLLTLYMDEPRVAILGMLQIFAMIMSTVGVFATLKILKQLSESHDKDTAQFRVWKSLHLTLAAMVTAWFAVKIYCIAFIRLLVDNA